MDLGEASTVNEGLKAYYQQQNPDITEFNTFYGWKKEGYQVREGEKAYLVWGRPKELEKKRQEAQEKGETLDTFDFHPLAYLFANTQVDCTRKEENPKYLHGKSNV